MCLLLLKATKSACHAVTAALTPRQEAALSALRAARQLKPKTHWNFSELPSITDDELAMVTQLHQRLQHAGVLASPEAVAYCSDTTLLRYIRAHEHQLDTAQRMLTATLTWRAAAKPWALVNEASLTNKRATNGRLLGLDHKGRVVVYSSLKHIDQRGPAEVCRHCIWLTLAAHDGMALGLMDETFMAWMRNGDVHEIYTEVSRTVKQV